MVRAARLVFGAWLVHSRAARRVAEIAARRSSVARLRSAATLLVGWRAASEVGAGGDSSDGGAGKESGAWAPLTSAQRVGMHLIAAQRLWASVGPPAAHEGAARGTLEALDSFSDASGSSPSLGGESPASLRSLLHASLTSPSSDPGRPPLLPP